MPKIKVKSVDQLSRKPVSYAHAAFMRHCQLKNLAPYSYLYYNKNIQYFLDTENKIKYVDEITPEVIERFIGKLMDRGNKVTAINTAFAVKTLRCHYYSPSRRRAISEERDTRIFLPAMIV